MKRAGNLFEKIVSFDNLNQAARKAMRGKKQRNQVAAFYFNLENEILALQAELRSQTYLPKSLRVFWISDPKARKISAADFRDRVVHHAIGNIIEPVLEKSYITHSYASRKGKGAHRAIKQAQHYTRVYCYFLKCDIKKYYESIDHGILKNLIAKKFKDPQLIWLLHRIIDNSSDQAVGIPIGNLTSQYFANFYLNRLDHYIKDMLGVKGYLRYMDDFILFDDEKSNLHLLKSKIAGFLKEELRLEYKENAIIIAPCAEGIPFLGMRIFPNVIRVKQVNKRRLLKRLKLRMYEYRDGIISEKKYVQSLMSITEYLKTADSCNFRRAIFFKTV